MGRSRRPGKVERATPLLNKLEKGEVFLPRYNNQWLSDLEGEWLSWTGLAEETADQIDAAAYAVNDLLQYDGRETVAVLEPYWRDPPPAPRLNWLLSPGYGRWN
jgi:phage terminase large subunit-like protein